MAFTPVKPYEGSKPYIFISYSHRDSSRVFPILRHLSQKGFRLWYDEGIDPGSEWPESIASHLGKCAVCIAFISENSLNSQNCRREINFAVNPDKHLNFISVMLEDAKLSPGIELQLSTYQSIPKFEYSSEEYFYEKLTRVEQLQPCNIYYRAPAETAGEAAGETHAEREEKPANGPAEKHLLKVLRWAIPTVLAAVLAVVLIAVLLNRPGRVTPDETDVSTPDVTEDPETTGQSPSETEPPVVDLSDDLNDFTFCLDRVYQLPCPLSHMEKSGWKINNTGVSPETLLDPGEERLLQMGMNDGRVSIHVINAGSSPSAIRDCQVFRIDVQQAELPGSDSFSIAREITGYSSKEDVLEAFGPAAALYTGPGYQTLTYGTSAKHCTVFQFNQNEPRLNSVSLCNYPRAARTIVTGLSGDLCDLSFLLDGRHYQIPFPLADLTDAGWKIDAENETESIFLGGYETVPLRLTKKDSSILVNVFNPQGNLQSAGDSLISEITVDAEHFTDPSLFHVAQAVTLATTAEDVVSAFGEASVTEDADHVLLSYGGSGPWHTAFSLYKREPVKNSIRLSFDTEEMIEYTMTVTDAPEYLSGYTAPEELGEDPLSGNVRFGGDLYRLPAPVSVFVENGWEIICKPAFVPARASESIRIEKDGLALDLSVRNFSDQQTLAENCAVTGILAEEENAPEFELPRGIAIGSDEGAVKEPGIAFTVSETADKTSYALYEETTGTDLVIEVLKKTGKVRSISLKKNEWNQ